MKTFKRSYKILSLVLSMMIVLSCMGTAGFAAQTETGLYDGTSELTLGADNRSVEPTVTAVEGNYGKAKSDTVYRVDVNAELATDAKYGVGYNFLKLEKAKTLETSVAEFSFLNPEAVDFAMQIGVFTSAATTDKITVTDESGETTEVSNEQRVTILTITDGEVKTGTTAGFFAPESSGKVLGTVTAGEWVNVAFVIPGYNSYENKENYSNKTIYVYINGVKNEIALENDFYGLRNLRFAPSGKTGEAKTFYLDNIRSYLATSTIYYEDTKDALPVVDFGALNVSGRTILADEGVTVNQLAEKITTTSEMRVFEDATYETLLSGDDEVPFGAKVVFATNNSYSTERAYSYYTVGQMTYEEPNLYEGALALTLGTNNKSVRPTVTAAEGNYGKAKSDTVYRVDVNAELATDAKYSTGYNFLTLDSGKKLDTTTAEFSFLNPGDVTFTMEISLFTSPATTDTIDVTDDSGATTAVSNLLKGRFETTSDGEIKKVTTSFFAESDSDELSGAADADKWTNIAIVVPGYNSYEDKENYNNKIIYVYVNGVKNEVTLTGDFYGVRHIRFAPIGDTGTSKTFYYDNIRRYTGTSESYDAQKDAQPVVDFSLVDAYEDNITVQKGTTVKAFKESIKTRAAVRVFADSAFKAQLEDEAEMGLGNIVVFATNNSRTTERAYAYYTVNNSVIVRAVKLTNADGKIIRGTQADIDRVGETYYLETVVTNKTEKTNAALKAIAVSYNADGKMVDYAEKIISAAPGTTEINATSNAVAFEGVETPEGGTLKAFLWVEENNRPLCGEFKAVFDGLEEYSVLAFGNSYSQDAFTLLPSVAKAAGIDIYAVNMYRGGCTLSMHFTHMKGDGVYPQRVEYMPDGSSITTENVSFIDGLNTPGYSWDYISLQSRSVEAYDFKYFSPYVAELADYIRLNSPSSEVLMHQTWVLDTETAKTNSYTKNLVASLSDEEIRPHLFSLLKQNYIDAAEAIGNPNRMVPVGEAINYAVGTLGFAEYVKNEDGTYNKSGRGMYQDTTCHLTTPYGRVLAALCWYEYVTGHDARENPYQNPGIPEEDIALLKEAAHWACTQSDYIKAQ